MATSPSVPGLAIVPVLRHLRNGSLGRLPARLCRHPKRWSVDHSPSTRRLAYCRGGIGVRDDGAAIGPRDGGTGVGLRAGAAGGCGGGSGIFKSISATADSSLAMSRAIEP
jgi:hypothetical protein